MHKLAVTACLALATWRAGAQPAPVPTIASELRRGPGAAIHVSASRQFMVREADNTGARPISLGTNVSVHYVRVDPTLTTVSCERIKHALLKEIGAPDNWRDPVYIDLRHAQTLDDPVFIGADRTERGWGYHISLPDVVEHTRLVTSMVDVTLLELANRKATERSAEIPAWLGYGLSEEILHASQMELVLEPGKPDAKGQSVSLFAPEGWITNALAIAHADLQAAPPLTIEQLSWPEEANLDGPAGEAYRASAQLFVHELLQLKDGRAAMQAFIRELPDHLNWQLSFLHAFRADFANQLELEKWWALRLADFSGRDSIQAWNPEESWQKLADIVRPTVEVRSRLDELPSRTQVSLQTIIEKWEMAQQYGFLRERSQQLYRLRSRVSQELAKLTDDYRRTIDLYLDKRTRDGYVRTARAQVVLGADRVARQTISDLNVLDVIREDLRPKLRTVQSVDVRKPR